MRCPAVALAGLALCSLSAGCLTKQKNEIYFAAVDRDAADPTIKFYRITVKAASVNQETELLTGYYDGDALKSLYGEVVKPEKTEGSGQQAYVYRLDPAGKQVGPVSETDRFTVFYGTNATAMAQQVTLVADAEEAGRGMGALMVAAATGDQFRRTQDAELAHEAQSVTAQRAVLQLEALRERVKQLKEGVEQSKDASGKPSVTLEEYNKLVAEMATIVLEVYELPPPDKVDKAAFDAKRPALAERIKQ